jgi:hypothetical protein
MFEGFEICEVAHSFFAFATCDATLGPAWNAYHGDEVIKREETRRIYRAPRRRTIYGVRSITIREKCSQLKVPG